MSVAKGANKSFRTFTAWVLIILIIIIAGQYLQKYSKKEYSISYSDFRNQITLNNIEHVIIIDRVISGKFKVPVSIMPINYNQAQKVEYFTVNIPYPDNEIVNYMVNNGVAIVSKEKPIDWFGVFLSTLPFVLLIAIWIFMLRQMQGGSNKAFNFGKSRAKFWDENAQKVTFNDVAGLDEAKEELQEIVEFLKNPARFQKLGGKIPKGALLVGSPGTGKTLLAKAVAGEANVPFLSISGSDFVEMFVGVGASRVRDLFDQAKKNAPCIIFIDEIDAVGRHRGAGLGGGHDEREQTLNALLVEMDGFETNEGVILIAATNRPDILDPALLRPGRFDRQVVVGRPDVKGRTEILKVHMRKVNVAPDVDPEVIAKGTPGMSGADLANIVNEAALLASRLNKDAVEMIDFEKAKDKVLMGKERKSLVISEHEKLNTAYHEAGHALIRLYLPGADPLHKVSIIPRGMALGVTASLPMDEKHSYTKEYILAETAVLLGGRCAEKLIFGENKITTGASNDIERVSDIVRKMVCNWGMSDLGPINFGKKEEEIFLGKEIATHRDYSETIAEKIDTEIMKIINEREKTAMSILESHRKELELIANALIEKETLDAAQIKELLENYNKSENYVNIDINSKN